MFNLTLEIHQLTMSFPWFKLYELGSQLRRSSNSSPANLAECFGNKHTNIYLEGISRAQGEIRETMHHLKICYSKKYLSTDVYNNFISKYEEFSKMLYGLAKSLNSNKI